MAYDGAKADIWAMGVMLCVMMIGKFPFEGDTLSTRNISEPLKQLFRQQLKKVWSDNKTLQDQLQHLSPEVSQNVHNMY